MKRTYRAMQISASGVLELVYKKLNEPRQEEVLIEIDVCGVCSCDFILNNTQHNYGHDQLVPGHEIVGRIVAKGENVPDIWSIGQRVGISPNGSYCQHCTFCRRGFYQFCEKRKSPGLDFDGGYAEYITIGYTALIDIPFELSSIQAAPIIYTGTAMFNALRDSGTKAGDRVAIIGMGESGHLAVQYARKMGYEVIVITQGSEKQDSAFELGAHYYIDSRQNNVPELLTMIGGANFILSCSPNFDKLNSLLPALLPGGKAMVVRANEMPAVIENEKMSGSEQVQMCSPILTLHEIERALRFSHMFSALPVSEQIPLEQASKVLERLSQGDVRYKIVLTMNHEI